MNRFLKTTMTSLHRLKWRKAVLVFATQKFGVSSRITASKNVLSSIESEGLCQFVRKYFHFKSTGPLNLVNYLLMIDYLNFTSCSNFSLWFIQWCVEFAASTQGRTPGSRRRLAFRDLPLVRPGWCLFPATLWIQCFSINSMVIGQGERKKNWRNSACNMFV